MYTSVYITHHHSTCLTVRPGNFSAKVLVETFVFFMAGEVDHDPPAPLGCLADVDLGPQRRAELLLERRQVLAAGSRGGRVGLDFARDHTQRFAVCGTDRLVHEALDRTDA